MQIIWHPEAAERLSNSHTVLELESFPVNGEILRAWCVVPAEKIGLSSLANLPALKDLKEAAQGMGQKQIETMLEYVKNDKKEN